MKKILFLAIAAIAVITLCFTNCKKKNDNNTSFPNGTSWTYDIVINDVTTGTITLNFTDKISGTVKLTVPKEVTTNIPATGYTYVDATRTVLITSIDLSGFIPGTPAIPLTGTFNADKTTLTVAIPTMDPIEFKKKQ